MLLLVSIPLMSLLKFILLNLFWFLCVYLNFKWQFSLLASSIILLIAYLVFFKEEYKGYRITKTLLMITFWGIIQDFLLGYLNLVYYEGFYLPYWITALYILFICYYDDKLKKLSSLPVFFQALIGGTSGMISYYSGSKLAGLLVYSNVYFYSIFLSWAIMFPLSLNIFYGESDD